MVFVHAEREGEWPLYLTAVQEMLPYFFAAGITIMLNMGCITCVQWKDFTAEKSIEGERVMRRKEGLSNCIWSNMYIGTTFIRYGIGPNDIIRVTMKPETLKK